MVMNPNITVSHFDTDSNGKEIVSIILKNDYLELELLNYGATINSLTFNKKGVKTGVVFGFDNLNNIQKANGYFGALVGPNCNRIGKGKFSIDGNDYQLEINDNGNNLHSGSSSYAFKVWDYDISSDGSTSVTFTTFSKDNEGGFPGNIQAKVKYELINNSMKIDITGISDKSTIMNMTNHSYYNLNGFKSGYKVDKHICKILADANTDVDDDLIPTGIKNSIFGTDADFSKEAALGKMMYSKDRLIQHLGGIDHNFHLKCNENDDAVVITGDISGIQMRVKTNQPCVQIYTTNMINPDNLSKRNNGDFLVINGAVCVETQCMPDSINWPIGDKMVYKPGEQYHSVTTYSFS